MSGVILYFSGTGNTRFIAHKFAEIMSNDYQQEFNVHSIEEKTNFQNTIQENSVIGFCYPIYGSCVPNIMRQFVTRYKAFLADKKIIIFCTQLMFSGDGARALTDITKDVPVEVILAEHFNMPNNICNAPIFKVRNGVETDKMVNKAVKRLERACRALNRKKKRLRGFNSFSYLLGLMQRPAFVKIEETSADKVKIDDKACSVCAKCVRECPTSNLFVEDNSIKSKGKCTLCYRCVNHCPRKAITVWISKKVTKQYKGIEG